jgi:hypothetical protein
MNSLVLRSLPVVDPERLAIVSSRPSPGAWPQYSYNPRRIPRTTAVIALLR